MLHPAPVFVGHWRDTPALKSWERPESATALARSQCGGHGRIDALRLALATASLHLILIFLNLELFVTC